MHNKLTAIAALFLAGACSTNPRETGIALGIPAADSTAIRADIAYLASDRLEGRMTGTPGNDSAAAYIARKYKALKLKAPFNGYLQPFVARSAAMAHMRDTTGMKTQNVVAILPGTDPVLRNQYIVIGAHFDHLGRTTQFATDPQAGNVIHNGADDNASGLQP
jgi:Peptidase family M28.